MCVYVCVSGCVHVCVYVHVYVVCTCVSVGTCVCLCVSACVWCVFVGVSVAGVCVHTFACTVPLLLTPSTTVLPTLPSHSPTLPLSLPTTLPLSPPTTLPPSPLHDTHTHIHTPHCWQPRKNGQCSKLASPLGLPQLMSEEPSNSFH